MGKKNEVQKTRKLIELIKNYPFLYNVCDKLYYDQAKRLEAWKKIASELGTTVPVAKQKWKTLRDGYVKYKKSLNEKNKKYAKWPWRSHLQFLSDKQVHTSNETPQGAPDKNESSEKTLEKSLKNVSNEENISIHFPSPDPSITSQPPDSLEGNSNESHQNSFLNSLVSASSVECDGGKAKADANRKFDGVDYLFMSYAESFKKLLPTTQAMLKFELASIFAKAEMKDLHVRCNISSNKEGDKK